MSRRMTNSVATVVVFSYGTLQETHVQLANFGRELVGRPDALPGYATQSVGRHTNVVASAEPGAAVPGTAFVLTEAELTLADRYEAADDYHRLAVTLRSGERAWVYVHRLRRAQPASEIGPTGPPCGGQPGSLAER